MSQYYVLSRRPYAESVYGDPLADPVPLSSDPEDGVADQPFDSLEAAQAFAAESAASHPDPSLVVVQVVSRP
jgi:hypothetical protein